MYRRFVIFVPAFLVWLFFSSLAFASNEFSDLPKNSSHFAATAVYQVVQMGIAGGFPDGTFRGDQTLTRSEICLLLAKYYSALSENAAVQEKLTAEFRSELAGVRDDLTEFKKEHGAKADGKIDLGYKNDALQYRIRYAFSKNFGADGKLWINFDTNDAGYNSAATREIATTYFDLGAQYKSADTVYQLVFGPGPILHQDSGVDPSENNQVFVRPRPMLKATKDAGGVNLSVAYVARQIDTSGKINLNEIFVSGDWVGHRWLGITQINISPTLRYLFSDASSSLSQNYHSYGSLDSVMYLSKKLKGSFFVGYGGGAYQAQGMGWGIGGGLQDIFNTGTTVDFSYKNIGNNYRTGLGTLEGYDLSGLNYFNRMILDNTADAGVKVTQKISDLLKARAILNFQFDANNQFGASFPGTSLTEEIDIDYTFDETVLLQVFYRLFYVPSGIDQLGVAVQSHSAIVGVKVAYGF